MDFDYDILTFDEKFIFDLRSLYKDAGYMPFKVSRFEQYELYAANKSFLPCDEIVAFTDAGGCLLALRPDVTLSIIKSIKNEDGLKKLYYNENVYRTIDGGLKEQMQVGLECIGDINISQIAEVLMLAGHSLSLLRGKSRLYISHMGFLSGLLSSADATEMQKTEIIKCISERNTFGLKSICNSMAGCGNLYEKLNTLISLTGTIAQVRNDLGQLSVNGETRDALNQLIELNDELENLEISSDVFVDFSVINDITYYNGIIFQGFIEGVPEKVLSGGRYDELLRNFSKHGGAVGFAINVDLAAELMRQMLKSVEDVETKKIIGVALPKGRLGETALELIKKAGFDCPDINKAGRKLVLDSPKSGMRFFWVKPSDVAIYVERGVADIGVVGKDTLMETNPDVFELLDLELGKCRMCIASTVGFNMDYHDKNLKVATKFPNIARSHFAKRGSDVDIIKLHGSIELAPLLGLSDVIVDLVETGKTLDENHMEIVDTISEISARLIANKTSYRFNKEKIDEICKNIGGV